MNTSLTAELSSDLVDRVGAFEPDSLRALFPLVLTCEFPNMPMHGCGCNGCVVGRLEELA